MITNPAAKRILCFGDSNTWGQTPNQSGRFAVNVRWTGVLQDALGPAYDIIEEGLPSRTTDLDYKHGSGRNGKKYLQPCLQAHDPLSGVLVMLGTNDCKIEFGPRTAEQITEAVHNLLNDVRAYSKNAKLAVVSPVVINAAAPQFATHYTGYFNQQSAEVSQQLSQHFAELAKQQNCFFFDAATVAKPGEDGVHMDVDSHAALGAKLASAVAEWV